MKCAPGTPPSLCVQTITSRWSVQSMMSPCDAHKGEWCTGTARTRQPRSLGAAAASGALWGQASGVPTRRRRRGSSSSTRGRTATRRPASAWSCRPRNSPRGAIAQRESAERPSALRYNANTGELLCGMAPGYGTGTEVYNEDGYLRIPPCVWGNPQAARVRSSTYSLTSSTRGHQA